MSPAARSVQVWGLYAFGVGLVLLLVPNLFLGVLGIPATDEPWLRLVGILALAIGVYYVTGARSEAVAFFRGTVVGRSIVTVGIVLLAVVWGYWAALLIAVAEIASAVWTWTALRRSGDAVDAATAT